MTFRHIVIDILALLFFLAIAGLVGIKSRRPVGVWAWSIGIGALIAIAGVAEELEQSGAFSPLEQMVTLVGFTALIAGPAFAIRAIVARRRPGGGG